MSNAYSILDVDIVLVHFVLLKLHLKKGYASNFLDLWIVKIQKGKVKEAWSQYTRVTQNSFNH